MTSRQTLRGGIVAALLLALTTMLAPAALAEDPVTFGAGSIVDSAGALGGDTVQVEDAIQGLYDQNRVQLYVTFVDSFTNPSDRTDWANTTATNNGFGTDDVLLAVAVDSRQYQLSVATDFALSDAQIASLQSEDIEPALSESDWSGAAVAAATGIEQRLGGTGSSTSSGSGLLGSITSGLLITAALFVGLIVVGVVIWLLVRRSRRKKAADANAQSIDELRKRAGSALVGTDDAVRTSEQELGFAEAQFGAESTHAFRVALDAAKAKLAEAFALQQQLDDAVPDSDEQRRTWYTQILQLCAEAEQGLDEQAADFDALRDLEKNAPAELERINARLADATGRIEPSESAVQALAGRYAASATASVVDNVDQAQLLIEFGASSIASARERISAGAPGEAAVQLRAAEQAAEQASELLDAIDKRGVDLADAGARLSAQATAIRADVAAAQALAAGSPAYGSPNGAAVDPGVVANVTAAIGSTTGILDEVERAAAVQPNDPLALLDQLATADTTIDTAVAGYRDAQAQNARNAAALAAELGSARSRIAAAEDFISTRRGAVGAEARTRVAEAARSLAYAEQIAPSDAAAALASAQRASQLAQQGLESARNDASAYSSDDGSLGGLLGGGRRSNSGAFLGGILFDQLLGGGSSRSGGYGGGRSSGGFGGGSRSGGFGGSSRSSSRRSTGSFGGSATRGRRGGGGHF
ncbi:TPM domain-containing protein [Microbacteriaceae bacterium VKM Ac-2854]|nr:TPM domain-containing protein [Microbacteriaceae bacterium VKM Ac-2854]